MVDEDARLCEVAADHFRASAERCYEAGEPRDAHRWEEDALKMDRLAARLRAPAPSGAGTEDEGVLTVRAVAACRERYGAGFANWSPVQQAEARAEAKEWFRAWAALPPAPTPREVPPCWCGAPSEGRGPHGDACLEHWHLPAPTPREGEVKPCGCSVYAKCYQHALDAAPTPREGEGQTDDAPCLRCSCRKIMHNEREGACICGRCYRFVPAPEAQP